MLMVGLLVAKDVAVVRVLFPPTPATTCQDLKSLSGKKSQPTNFCSTFSIRVSAKIAGELWKSN